MTLFGLRPSKDHESTCRHAKELQLLQFAGSLPVVSGSSGGGGVGRHEG
jgi:hypothetical protein